MVSIKIVDSYKIWSTKKMKDEINNQTFIKYHSTNPEAILNRCYTSMYIEWYLHNFGYYLTLPFISNKKILKYNLRFKDVDLEEWK